MHDLMTAVVVVVMVLAAMLGTAVLLGVLAVRACVRAVRPVAQRAGLRARSYGVGPAAEAARLRLDLHASVTASGRVVAVARAREWPVGDAASLQHRLEDAARALDAQLRAVETECDRARAGAAVAAVRLQVRSVLDSAGGLRTGLLCAGARLQALDLDTLARDCAVEARALRG